MMRTDAVRTRNASRGAQLESCGDELALLNLSSHLGLPRGFTKTSFVGINVCPFD